ncbi:superoxide dismutase family protein [Fodinicurvata halophila]|uniref:Superoxide dismutase family protein n=1 Tax=Fodinicurvata halophila TaxID=1419723 RepID=A0ABV8UL88_9PROT
MQGTRLLGLLAVAICLATLPAQAGSAESVSTEVHRISTEGREASVGEVTFTDTKHGLLVDPDLENLQPAGPHAAHVHEQGDCGPGEGGDMAGAAAGGHYDPQGTGRHEGPYGEGHLGDLPNLIVEKDGAASIPVLAPRLQVSDIRGRSLMIHAKPDRYTSHGMHTHGKGGLRMYCGVIE